MKKLRLGILLFVTCLLLVVSSCKKPTYKVEFYDGDKLLKVEEVVEGNSATAPDTTKEGYTFLSWSKSFKEVTSDLKINALYQINEYTVNFYGYNNEYLFSETVKYGDSLTSINGFDVEGNVFLNWDKDLSKITSNLDVYGVYKVKEYKVEFLDNENNIVKTEYVAHGSCPTDFTGPDTTSHKFVGWSKLDEPIYKDTKIKGIYELKKFTVTYLDENGTTVLHTEVVEYGKDAKGFTPDRKGNLSFAGWSDSIKKITSDKAVIASYAILSHNISFFDGTEKLDLGIKSYNEGEETVLPTYEKEGYYFLGWYLSDLSHTNYQVLDGTNTTNLLLYARFLPLKNYNQIKLPDAPYHFTTINKSTTYQAPLPSGVPSGVTNYDWTTSDTSVATVSIWSSISIKSSGFCILTATYKDDPSIVINCIIKVTADGISVVSEEEANEYTVCNVVFKDKEGNIISETKCAKGGSVVYPVPTVYPGYKFVGWDRVNYNITEDTVINATYEQGVNNYTGKSFAIIGDSISTYASHIPAGFSCFYPYPTADVTDVNKTWWMQVINKVGGTLFVNNSYSGSCVADSSSSATKNESRLEYTTINGVAPDVILIYMGSNDCASKYVSLYDFDRDYPKMIENLQKLCPDSEIILCTLATSPFYTVSDQLEYNEVIAKYGNEYGLRVLDLSGADLTGKLVDSAHPNTSGMTEFANEVIEKLLEE